MTYSVDVRDGNAVWITVAEFRTLRYAQSFCNKLIPAQDWRIQGGELDRVEVYQPMNSGVQV